jgi:hypothetical protein
MVTRQNEKRGMPKYFSPVMYLFGAAMGWVLLLSAWGQFSVPSSAPMTAALLKPVATGGPDTWYDAIDQASTTQANSANNGIMLFSEVTVVQAGTCTKLRVYSGAPFSGDSGTKIALYTKTGSGTGNLLSSGTVTVTGTGYFEVTLSAAQAVSATAYYVAWIPENVNLTWRYLDGQAADASFYATETYATFPPAAIPAANALPWKFAAGMYVD